MKSLVSANHFELLFNKPSLGASLPSSGWRCFHKPRRPSHSLIFFIQHFPFSIRCNDKTQFQGKLWTILVSSPILTKWRRCHWWWWHPKLRCQPLLLLLDTRLDTRTFYYYSTRTRLEVKNHYSQGPVTDTRYHFKQSYLLKEVTWACFILTKMGTCSSTFVARFKMSQVTLLRVKYDRSKVC